MQSKYKISSVTRGHGLLEGFLAKKRSSMANKLLKNAKKEKILDIGCGSYPYFLLSSNFKEKYGIDPSLKLVSNKKLKLLKKDATKQKLSFADNFFDVVTMLAVFEHIDGKKLNSLLKEIRRVLKGNGVLIITTPSSWSDKLLHNMAKIGLISSEEIHEHKHNHRKKKIEDIILEAGFEKERIRSGYFEVYMNMWFTAGK